MGGRGGRAGYLGGYDDRREQNPNPDSDQRPTRRRNNPDHWDEQSLSEWERDHPEWERPSTEGMTQEEYQQFLDDHPGWGDQEPAENQMEGMSRQELNTEISRAGSEDEQHGIIDEWIEDNSSTNPDGTVNFEMNGVTITADPDDPRIYQVMMALVESGNIPKRLLEKIDSITLSDQAGTSEVEYLNGDIIIPAGQQANESVIAQGAAEGLAIGLWGSETPPAGSDYWRVMQTDEPPATDYGRSSPAADFTEAVRMYVSNPRWLRDHHTLRYRVIWRIFHSRRYKG